MLTTTIHLTTCDTFQQQGQLSYSQTIIEAFVESCKALDASIFEPFMEEDNVFENKNKYVFLAALKTLFDSFKKDKPVSINIVVNDGTCAGCNHGKAVKIFSVKGCDSEKYNDRFGYVIEKKDGILKDIFRCNFFCNR